MIRRIRAYKFGSPYDALVEVIRVQEGDALIKFVGEEDKKLMWVRLQDLF